MMYVIKVGDYYVKSADLIRKDNNRTLYVGDILLSKELMRNFDKNMAELIANKINGEIITMDEEVTNYD